MFQSLSGTSGCSSKVECNASAVGTKLHWVWQFHGQKPQTALLTKKLIWMKGGRMTSIHHQFMNENSGCKLHISNWLSWETQCKGSNRRLLQMDGSSSTLSRGPPTMQRRSKSQCPREASFKLEESKAVPEFLDLIAHLHTLNSSHSWLLTGPFFKVSKLAACQNSSISDEAQPNTTK